MARAAKAKENEKEKKKERVIYRSPAVMCKCGVISG
jgi:hypothetical protein